MCAPTGTTFSWNGPSCPTCGARYLGSHTCSPADIARRIAELSRLLDEPRATGGPIDQTRACPCRPENGGSGMCGCILGGLTVTS